MRYSLKRLAQSMPIGRVDAMHESRVSLLRDRHRACRSVRLTSCTSVLPHIGVEWLSGSPTGFIVVEIKAISGEFVEGAKAISDQGFHVEGDFRGCLEDGDDFWWWSRQWWRFLVSLYGGDNMGADEEGAESEGIVEGLIEEGRVGPEKQLARPSGFGNVVVASASVGVEILVGVPLPKRNIMSLYQLEKLKIEMIIDRHMPTYFQSTGLVKYNSLLKEKEDEVELVRSLLSAESGGDCEGSDNGGEVTRGGEDKRGEEVATPQREEREAQGC
ncbi:unnamed protein product [Prunus armeniaca]